MKTGVVKDTVSYKFGKTLKKGIIVEIRQTNENTYMVKKLNEPNIEYIISKSLISGIYHLKNNKKKEE